jgi:hypothetical protein
MGIVAHVCNPSVREAKAGGSHVLGQPKLHNKTLSQKTKKEGGRGEANKTISLLFLINIHGGLRLQSKVSYLESSCFHLHVRWLVTAAEQKVGTREL